jgi:hypothetical protein
MTIERRGGPRFPFIAEAVVTDAHSGVRMNVRTSDLGGTGCYFDMMNPLPLGTEVKFQLTHQGVTFTGTGTVENFMPNMGIGIKFNEIEDQQREILDKWLAALNTKAR